MYPFHRFFLVAAILLWASSTAAGAASDESWRKVAGQALYPWSQGLAIRFDADEEKCKAAYGNRWQSRCSTPMGRHGDRIRGIQMEPAAAGEWRWSDPYTAVFEPQNGKSIKPDSLYEIDLTDLRKPRGVKLNRNRTAIKTAPKSVRVTSDSFLVDPAPKGRHRLVYTLEFNFPQEKEPEIKLTLPAGAKAGQPEKVWNLDRDGLAISWPILKLPQSEESVELFLPDFGKTTLKNNDSASAVVIVTGEGARFKRVLPGSDSIFRIVACDLKTKADDRLDNVLELELATSLYARPEEMLKNLLVYELPLYNGVENTRPYNWELAPALSKEKLRESRKLDVQLLANNGQPRSKFAFRVPATAGRHLLIIVQENLGSANGSKLQKSWARILKTPDATARVGFLQPGSILSAKKSGVIDFFAVDADQIVWTAQKIRKPFLALTAAASSSPFKWPLDQANLGLAHIAESVAGSIQLAQPESGIARYAALNLAEVLKKLGQDDAGATGLINVILQAKRDGKDVARAEKMILAADLGLMAKTGADGSMDFFVRDLVQGAPAPDARIEIIGKNGKAVANVATDEKGHARIPSLNGLKGSQEPVCAIAEKGDDFAWLPLADLSRVLNFSDFPVGGAHTSQDGLNVFIFSQRDIGRPGEEMHFGVMIRKGDFSLLPANLPLFAEILDPAGRLVWSQIFKSGKNGLAELTWKAPQNSMTGRYVLNIKPARDAAALAARPIRIEEFQPDGLKLKLETPEISGWLPTIAVEDQDREVKITLSNLFGSPAPNHKIDVELQMHPAKFKFAGYENYSFADSRPFLGDGIRSKLPSLKTDENGNAAAVLPSELLRGASAEIEIQASGFAAGGRATTAKKSFLVSPMEKILGHRFIGEITNPDFIGQNNQAQVEFIALNSSQEKIEWPNLTFSIGKKQYLTNLISDGSGGYRYDDTPVVAPFVSEKKTIEKNGSLITLPTLEPGDYELKITDDSGRVLSRISYAVAGDKLLAPDDRLAAGKLRAKLDRRNYKSGDQINVALSLPYSGVGLLAIERENVKAFSWFEAQAGDCVQTIRLPENFEGKGYVTVSFARDGDSPAIYKEPHAFSVLPFTANMESRKLELKLDAPDSVRNGENAKIKISAPVPTQVIAYAVDEGILQLTNYQIPNPIKGLLEDRALDVKTIQAYDLLMPEHGKIASRLSRFGGGMDSSPFGMAHQNPYKRRNEDPVVFWSGVIDAGPDESEIVLPIPEYYTGAIKIIAIGANEDKCGSAEKTMKVAAPVILTPHLPLFVSPGDLFGGYLTISNLQNKKQRIELEADAGEDLQLISGLPAEVELEPNSERVFSFELAASDYPGASEIIFSATNDEGETFQRTISISCRPASPLRSTFQAGRFENASEIPVNRKVFLQNAASKAAISTYPLPLAQNFAQYLNSYPYGCSEQLISRAFGLILLERLQPGIIKSESSEKLIQDAVSAIRARSTFRGISLWPGVDPDLLLTIYAADFLLALRESGHGVNSDLLEQLCESIEESVNINEPSLENARVCAYGIWILTRSGRVTTQMAENLLSALADYDAENWRKDLTIALLAASQREMHIQNSLPFPDVSFQEEGWLDKYAQYSLYMTLLARYFPEKLTEEEKDEFFDETVEVVTANNFATFSASQGLRALAALSSGQGEKMLDANIICADGGILKNKVWSPDRASLEAETAFCNLYKFEAPRNKNRLFWQITTTGYDKQAPADAESHGLMATREYMNEDDEVVATVGLGDVVKVRLVVSSPAGLARDCVIEDLIPGGFDMLPLADDGKIAAPENRVKFIRREDDRLLLFADLTPEPLVVTYWLRAVNPGKFSVSPVNAQSMYNPQIFARGAAGKLSISK